jgi:HD-GYP domain-containing protein (c-di-GMP phosphodiesterase class II)
MAARKKTAEGKQPAARARYERDELLAISRALASERDIRKLLDLILFKSRQISGADAGSVYVLESTDKEAETTLHRNGRDKGGRRRLAAHGEGKRALLRFMLSHNDSMAVDFQEFTLPVDEKSMAGRAVLHRRSINIADLGTVASADLAGLGHNRSFDQQTGYQARSMLTVPMISAEGDAIGVIQLINKKREPRKKLRTPADFDSRVVPFQARDEEMLEALAAQAGVSLENAILYDEIRRLFESFVDASVTAIEARDPTTSGHSRRVATLSVALAETVDGISEGPLREVRFSREELRQLEYAGVLHDFGKVGVREQVLVKAKKLYAWQLGAISMRLGFVRKSIEAEILRGKLALFQSGGGASAEAVARLDREQSSRLAAVDDCWQCVLAANEPSVTEKPVLARLRELAGFTYLDGGGVEQPFLTQDELLALEVPRGSLTQDERKQIQSHVDHTINFLRAIPWGRELRRVPSIAAAHHEMLDGSGYPTNLRGEAIAIESRMLTIADIFDALTASDRPYKAAVPAQRALGILESDVRAGKCDPELFRIFVEAEIWKRVM